MENEKLELTSKQKEICLFDILVFFVRYRKIIIIPTLIGFVISVLSFFVIPKVFHFKSEEDVLIIYGGFIEKMTPELSSYLNMNLPSLVEKELRDYKNISESLKEYKIFPNEGLSDRQYNAFIKKIIDENKVINISVSGRNNTFQISAEIPEKKVDDYKSFIQNYVEACSNKLENQLNLVLYSSESNLDNIVSRNEENKSSDFEKLISVRLAIKNFKDTHTKVCYLDEPPFESNIIPKIGRVKKTLIVTIIIFIISLLIALTLKAVEVIKKDPDSNKIISDAWKAGKL